MAQAEAVALESQDGELARAAGGDQEAFAELVRRHQRLVYSIAWHFFADRAVAEDLSQEVFLQLFQNMRSIETDSHLVFWLRQVTSRKCIDHARWQEKRRHPSLDEVAEQGAPGAPPDLLENDRLRRLVTGMPEKLRAVVVLRFQEEMNPSEIAAALGWPVNSVKSCLHRALRMLRDRLGVRC
jgi:RNA polymerase sigma-70 factor (ECF subfamily)